MSRHFFALLLTVSTVAVAVPEDTPVAREIATLRRTHEEGLDRLLEKALKERNLVAVSAICTELKAIRTEAPKVENGKAPLGCWSWAGGYDVVMSSNGLAVWNDKNYGIWKWLNESERKAEIRWDNGFTDTFTVSPDGKMLHLVNNQGVKYTAELTKPKGEK